MTNWKEYKLGEIAELRREKFTPNDTTSYPYIGLEHIEPKSLRINGIGTSNDVSSQKSVFYPNDTLYGKLRPYFQKVYSPDFKGVCSTDIFVVKPKKGIDAKYLFYVLASDEFTTLANSGSTGTRMPRADWKHLSSTIWNLPDLPTQTAIAEILSSLDDKIELNNKINQELENLAQTLFKHWFIDFEFPNENGEPYKSSGGEMVECELGEIPKGWNVGTFGDLCKVINGYAFKSKDFQETGNNGILKIRNVNGSIVDIINTQFVASDVVKSVQEKFRVLSGHILIAMTGAEVGKIGIVPETDKSLWLNQRVGRFEPIVDSYLVFIYHLFNVLNFTQAVRNSAMGSAQPNISSSGIEALHCIIPSKEVIQKYSSINQDAYNLTLKNLGENQELSNLRDTLLPKLISGELELTETN